MPGFALRGCPTDFGGVTWRKWYGAIAEEERLLQAELQYYPGVVLKLGNCPKWDGIRKVCTAAKALEMPDVR